MLGVAVLLAMGCGGSKKFAPVSGTVTLDGKPLVKAEVSFQPIAAPGSIEAGVGSVGITDEQGHYALKTPTGEKGAVPGKHQVRISLYQAVQERDERAAPVRRGGPRKENKENTIPEEYNEKTKLEFTVPAGGSDKADFELKTPEPDKKKGPKK
jgi:hypothetical protein